MVCKNCNTNTIGKICHTCGQRTDTQRLTVKGFLDQEIIKKYLYFDQNFTSTLKDVLLKPGVVSWNYIHGRRKRYFNLVSLLGVVIAVYIFIDKNSLSEYTLDGTKYSQFISFVEAHFNEIFFINIFILALFSWVIFKRLRLNIIEHGVVSLVIVIGSALIGILSNILYGIGLLHYHQLAKFPWWLEALIDSIDFSTLLFIAFVYFQFIGNYYNPRWLLGVRCVFGVFAFFVLP